MKKIIVIVNHSMEKHAMRFIKHRYAPIDLFHIDVKSYGTNPSENILDNLDLSLTHMVLTSNPLTAFKLVSKYDKDVSICLMDDECDYQEIQSPTIEKVIRMACAFDMPNSLMLDESDYIDCSVPEFSFADGFTEINDWIGSMKDKNILVVSDLLKLIHTTENNVKVGFAHIDNVNNNMNAFSLSRQLKDIDYIVYKFEMLGERDIFLDTWMSNFNINGAQEFYYQTNSDDEMMIHAL